MKSNDNLDSEVFYRSIATAAIREYKAIEKSEQKKRIRHNTSVLLNHYLDLKYFFTQTHAKCTIDNESIILDSVRKSKLGCRFLMMHINQSLKRLQDKFKDTPVKFDVIKLLYLTDELGQLDWKDRCIRVGEMLNISESTLKRYRKEMEEELSVLLFGPDGLKILTI